jgi:hypothetical protein
MHGLLTAHPQIAANDEVIAKEMADALFTAYPGHLWAVHVDGKQGMADIRNLHLSGKYGYRLRMPLIYSASAFKKDVLRAGGEILERFDQRRGKVNPDHIETMPVDFAGRLKADYD